MQLQFYSLKILEGKPTLLPFFEEGISAGFPSPAEGYLEKTIDLNEHLVSNPASTFFIRVSGSSMREAEIHDGDILIVDRSVDPGDGKIIIAILEDEFTVKRLHIKESKGKGREIYLMPENPEFKPILVTQEMNFRVWGVVTYVIKAAK